MATPKRPTGEQHKANKANAAVLALPAAGYGLTLILEGLGSVSLPSITLPAISGSAAAMAAPIALTLAGPAYGLYETITGLHHLAKITPLLRLARIYAPDATRVNRPIVVSRTRVGGQSQSRPIGEMYISPVLTRAGSVNMASQAESTSTGTTSQGTTLGTVNSAQGGLPQQQLPEDEKPKDKKKDGSIREIRDSAKRTLGRIKKGYTVAGKGLTNLALLTTLVGGPIAGGVTGGLAFYNWLTKDDPTPAEIKLEEAKRRYDEALKESLAREIDARTDSIVRRSYYNPALDTVRAGTTRLTRQLPIERATLLENNPF